MSHFIMIARSIVELGHAERARDDAVAAGDAARLARALDDAVAGALDRVGRADLGAGRLLAVHADDRAPSARVRAIDVLEMDHRLAAVRVALGARLHARLAADAAARVDEELEVLWDRHLLLRLPLGRVGRRRRRPCARGSRTPCTAGSC